MDEQMLDVDYWEEVWDKVSVPVSKKAEDLFELHRIFLKFLPKSKKNLLEIGCAPGSWLVYFYNYFNYTVSGVEYASKAYEKTIENLRIQDIPNEIFLGDFFDFEHAPYDVVFSYGFVEHFEEINEVFRKISNMCTSEGGLVITIIPNMHGINRWISKTFRPSVAAGHFPITKQELQNYHEQFDLKTLYCEYAGSFNIICPIKNNPFAKKHSTISWMLNLPFRAWNRVIRTITQITNFYPKSRFLARSIIYIGTKKNKK